MALFGGIAKVLLAVILMVSEMTMDYTLLVPSMLACTIAYFIASNSYIYENQVPTKTDSPAHKAELSVPLLKRLKVADFMKSDVIIASPDSSLADLVGLMRSKKIGAVPILDKGKLAGIVATLDIAMIPKKKWPNTSVRGVMKKQLIVGYHYESLHKALGRMTQSNISHLPIVDPKHPERLLGILTIKDIALSYDYYREDLGD